MLALGPLGLVVPPMRGLTETWYQFDAPWVTDSTLTEETFGLAPTPLADGIAATVVADASDLATDAHLWERGYFGIAERTLPGIAGHYPHEGPAWGHGPGVPLAESLPVGADTRTILAEVGGYSEAAIDALYESGAAGTAPAPPIAPHPADHQTRIDRGELSRVDADHGGWRALAAQAEGAR